MSKSIKGQPLETQEQYYLSKATPLAHKITGLFYGIKLPRGRVHSG